MTMFRNLFRSSKSEKRSALENPAVPTGSDNVLSLFGLDNISATGASVTIESALGVTAVFCAVNFLAGTLAALPLHVYKRTDGGNERVKDGLGHILHNAVNDGQTSFDWRKYSFEQVFTGGRSYSFIERNALREVINILPLDPAKVRVKRNNGVKTYEYKENGKTRVYEASEILDIAFMLKADGVSHRSPIFANRDTIGLAIAVTKYGARFFNRGGVPPFTITGPIRTPSGMERAVDDLSKAVTDAANRGSNAIALPHGHELKPLGVDPEKTQFVDTKRLLIEEIARIYSLPPVFLQDLSKGTFANTEQQDLQLVKHTLTRWAKQFEQELNLKLFGRAANGFYVKLNLDGLLRGDFKTRMEGNAKAIQTGQMTPDEARELEDRPALGGAASKLHMQGAMLPIDRLGHNGGPPLHDDVKDGDDDPKT